MQRFLLLLCSLLCHNVYAVPLIYQFDGEIDFISSTTDIYGETILFNPGDRITLGDTDFSIGERLQYSIYLDFDRPGRCVDPRAILSDQCMNINIVDPPGIDFFYTDLWSATKLVPMDYLNIDYNFGRSGYAPTPGILQVDSSVYIYDNLTVQEWIEGMHFKAVDAWDNGNDIYGFVSSSLELTSIRLAPVTETAPLILLLLGLGMIIYLPRLNTNKE